MKPAWMHLSELPQMQQTLFETIKEKEFEKEKMLDLAKLQQLLAKLNPLYVAMHPFSRPANRMPQFIRGLAAFVLCSFVSMSLFASDFVLPPDQYVSPAMTLQQAANMGTTTVVPPASTTSTDSFYSRGPLSTPTSVDTGSVTATTTPSYYVSSTGSDQGNGSAAAPWKSLQYAVSRLQAGDTLTIQEGTYDMASGANFTTSGRSDAYITIQGQGNVVIDGTNLFSYTPVFDTKGQSYIKFKNLTVNNARDAVEVSPGSTNVEVDGLKTDGNDFAVKINGGENITVRNVYAINSRNAFRVEGASSRNILFENIETYGAKDIYAGYDPNYTNGDGFILEAGSNITLRNIISGYNWDAGFDIKANNVTVENVVAIGNKNNFKTWGTNIVIKSSLSYDAKRQAMPSGGTVDGNGINVRSGNVKLVNVTFANNEDDDIKLNGGATIQLQNSIIARNLNNGGNIVFNEGGTFLEDNNVWYVAGKTASNAFAGSPVPFTVSSASKFGDPGFVNWAAYNFRLKNASAAIDTGNSSFALSPYDLDGNTRVNGSAVDAGAYEYYPGTVTPPVITAVASSSVTQTAASISWTTDKSSDSQVEYRVKGTTPWLATVVNASLVTNHSVALNGLTANTDYEYRVKSKDSAGNLAVQTSISSFKTLAVATPPPPPPTTCTTAICGVTAGQTVSGTVKVQPNLTLNPNVKKVSYYLNGTLSTREYASPFIWGGAGFDTTKLTDGNYTLSGAYTTKAGDQSFSITFSVKNSGADTTVPVISAVSSSNITPSGVTINWTTNEASDSQVEYRVAGSTAWLATGLNASMVLSHSVTLSGWNAGTTYEYRVKSKDQAGNLATQGTVSTVTTAAVPPVTACTTAICGVTNGQTVGGIIKIQPNLSLNPDVKKVSYYLNGALSGREYAAPFTWGGSGGIDTTKMADGTYTLSGAYTTNSGDKPFTLTFTVKNSASPAPAPVPTVCTTAMCGISSGQVLSGTVLIQPNLTLNPGIKKVSYYLNGTLYERDYAAPFTMGAATGLDTKTLANGTYIISGAYTTAAGDVSFTFTVTVRN